MAPPVKVHAVVTTAVKPQAQSSTRQNRSITEQIALRSNIFRSTSRGPSDSRGREVNLRERCNSKHIHRHIGPTQPYIVKEIFSVEDHYYARENEMKATVKVLKITPKKEAVEAPLHQSATFGFTNHITKMVLQYHTDCRTALETATMLQEEIEKFAESQKETLLQNRKSVRDRVVHQNQADYQRNLEESKKNKIEVKRIYRSIQEIVQHILEKGGESKHVRATDQEEESTAHITLDFIKDKQRQVEESKSAADVMQLVRVFLNKKTEDFDALHRLYGDEIIADPSVGNDATTVVSDSISVASDRISRAADNLRVSEEDAKLGAYYDFNVLKKKWAVKTEEEVKENIRRILTRQVLSTGQRAKVKQEVEEQQAREKLMQSDPRYAQKVQNEKRKKAQSVHDQKKKEQEDKKKQQKDEAAKEKERSQSGRKEGLPSGQGMGRQQSSQQNPLKQKQDKVKKEFFETNVNFGLAYGEVFERTRNFGDLFQTKAQEYYKKATGLLNPNASLSQDTRSTFLARN